MVCWLGVWGVCGLVFRVRLGFRVGFGRFTGVVGFGVSACASLGFAVLPLIWVCWWFPGYLHSLWGWYNTGLGWVLIIWYLVLDGFCGLVVVAVGVFGVFGRTFRG